MNAFEQVKDTLYRQRIRYLMDHAISPNDLTVRVTVSPRTRSEIIRCVEFTHEYCSVRKDQKETILGEPLEVAKDMPDNVYYLDLIVYNRVQKQLKFTLQRDSNASS